MNNLGGCGNYCSDAAETLNKNCFCTTLNREQLETILRADDITHDMLTTQSALFSNTSVFISSAQLQQLRTVIQTVTRVTNIPAYQQHVMSHASAIARADFGTVGVFMGYDFHLSEQGPHIIEINTNAGGAFLNAALVKAQTECCRVIGAGLPVLNAQLDQEFMAMFLHEWQLQCPEKSLKCIAIVDENPTQQFLYPEFKMAQRLFERNAIHAIIVDPKELHFTNGVLMCREQVVDLVYNRLTDFSLSTESSAVLRQSYEAGAVVLTPNPHHYALYADKRNLVLLSDADGIKKIGASEQDIKILQAAIPKTQIVSAENANTLWNERKQLFFKPACGFGSRAAYRGDKLTRRVWDDIVQGDYVAQKIVQPSERGILVDNEQTALKMDIRAYVYDGQIQLLAARLYQGQTTNFRTQGGGFAPVFIAQ